MATSSSPVAAENRVASPLRGALRTAIRRPGMIFGLTWLAFLVFVSVFAYHLPVKDPFEQDVLSALQPPSADFWLGTDALGRDVIARLVHGGGLLLASSVFTVIVGLIIGVPLGLLAGYRGGRAETLLSFAFNVMLSIPGFVILIAIVIITSNNIFLVMGVLGVLFSANNFRLVRATTQAVRSLPYVEAARVAGISGRRIMFRHVLPNITGPLLVQAFLGYTVALIISTSLSFLGLGTSPELPSWGQLIFEATQNINRDPWLMVPVGVVLILTAMAANFIGSSLRDALPHAQRHPLLVLRQAKSSLESAGVTPADWSRDALLSVRDLSVSFPMAHGEQLVVDHVSFDVERGTTLGLVGESGCGKTLTALALLGLLPPPGRRASGSMMFDGRNLAELDEAGWAKIRGKRIALVSQEPMVALDPCFSIGSQLREPLMHHRRLSRRAADAQALELLRLVGIGRPESVAKSFPHQISGGMAQRVGIAIALAGEPELLIADEPTTALDVTIQAEILDLLRSLQAELGMTVIIVTHDLGVVSDFCQKALVMYAGQVIEAGPVAEVLVHPSHPYTKGLLAAVPDLSRHRAELATIQGTVPLPRDWPSGCRFADRCPEVQSDCHAQPIRISTLGADRKVRCLHASAAEGARS